MTRVIKLETILDEITNNNKDLKNCTVAIPFARRMASVPTCNLDNKIVFSLDSKIYVPGDLSDISVEYRGISFIIDSHDLETNDFKEGKYKDRYISFSYLYQ